MKLVSSLKLLTIWPKCWILVLRLGSEYASENLATEYVCLPDFPFFYWQKSMTDILFITLEQHLPMSFSSNNLLMPSGSNRSFTLKKPNFIYRFLLKNTLFFYKHKGNKHIEAEKHLNNKNILSMCSSWQNHLSIS